MRTPSAGVALLPGHPSTADLLSIGQTHPQYPVFRCFGGANYTGDYGHGSSGDRMKIASSVLACLLSLATTAQADECRRVTMPTVLAIVVHNGVWTRPVALGKTFKVKKCGIRMYGNVYCQLDTDAKPPVYVLDGDPSGKEYTAFWGKACR